VTSNLDLLKVDEGRSGDDGGVVEDGRRGADDNVRDTTEEGLGDTNGLVLLVHSNKGCRAAIDVGNVESARLGSSELERDVGAGSRLSGQDGESGVSLDGRGKSTGALARSGNDELGGKSINLAVLESRLERSRESRLASEGVEVGRVPSLDGEDGAGGAEVSLAADIRGSSEVGGGADGLEDEGEAEESLDGGNREVVLARLDTSGSEGTGEEGDVGLLLGTDEGDPLVDGSRVASLLEVSGRELLETLGVESGLEVLESEGVVQDLDIGDGRGGGLLDEADHALLTGDSGGGEGGNGRDGSEGELHS